MLFPTNQFVKIQNFGIGNSWNHEVNYAFLKKMIHCAAYYCSKVESRDYNHSCEEKLEKSCQITTWDVIPAKITKWMPFFKFEIRETMAWTILSRILEEKITICKTDKTTDFFLNFSVIWNSWNHVMNHTFLENNSLCSVMYCFKVE